MASTDLDAPRQHSVKSEFLRKSVTSILHKRWPAGHPGWPAGHPPFSCDFQKSKKISEIVETGSCGRAPIFKKSEPLKQGTLFRRFQGIDELRRSLFWKIAAGGSAARRYLLLETTNQKVEDILGMNGVAVARHGLILWENEATSHRISFKCLPD